MGTTKYSIFSIIRINFGLWMLEDPNLAFGIKYTIDMEISFTKSTNFSKEIIFYWQLVWLGIDK